MKRETIAKLFYLTEAGSEERGMLTDLFDKIGKLDILIHAVLGCTPDTVDLPVIKERKVEREGKNEHGVLNAFVDKAFEARDDGFALVCLLCGTGLNADKEKHECDGRFVDDCTAMPLGEE